jgi:hypothetical protein
MVSLLKASCRLYLNGPIESGCQRCSRPPGEEVDIVFMLEKQGMVWIDPNRVDQIPARSQLAGSVAVDHEPGDPGLGGSGEV